MCLALYYQHIGNREKHQRRRRTMSNDKAFQNCGKCCLTKDRQFVPFARDAREQNEPC